jgi:hypothetical protein
MDILQQGFSGKKVRGGIYFVMKGVVVWMRDQELDIVEVNT